MQTTELTIPGRGLDYDLTMTYRSDVVGTDACCGGWEMSYSRRLVVVDPNNLAEYQAAFPSAKVGDVDQVDDNDRDDLYVLNGSSYISPAGYYSQLLKNPDGSYTERFADGTVYDYSRPDAMGVATLKSESDANGDTMQFVYNDQEQLTTVYDTLGRPIQYSYNTAGELTQVQDYMGRTVTFGYDANGDLTSVTSPAVTGTPTGNNFANGVTTMLHLQRQSRDDLDDGPRRGPRRRPAPDDLHLRRPGPRDQHDGGRHQLLHRARRRHGHLHLSDARHAHRARTTPPRPPARPSRPTATATISIYDFNQYNDAISITQAMNRGIDSGIPTGTMYTTLFSYDTNYRLLEQIRPAGQHHHLHLRHQQPLPVRPGEPPVASPRRPTPTAAATSRPSPRPTPTSRSTSKSTR